MAQKKETPESTEKKRDVKVQDLAPKKDAKGGAKFNPNAMNQDAMNQNASNQNAMNQNAGIKRLD